MTFIISPDLQRALDKIDAAFKPNDFVGPRLPMVGVGKARYHGQWMPPASTVVRAMKRGERIVYPVRREFP